MIFDTSISEFFTHSIEKHDVSNDDGLQKVLFDICDAFDLTHATYYGTTNPSDRGLDQVLITTYPVSWITHYFSNNYQDVDPILLHGSRSLLPLQWKILSRSNEQVADFFTEAREFGVGKQGLTISVRGLKNDSALMSFNKNCSWADWQGFCSSSLPDLNFFAFLLHDKVLANRSLDTMDSGGNLTIRETQALCWAARGKTAWETGKILGLTEKTVSFYVGNACAKLKVATKTQAVAKAVYERLIWF